MDIAFRVENKVIVLSQNDNVIYLPLSLVTLQHLCQFKSGKMVIDTDHFQLSMLYYDDVIITMLVYRIDQGKKQPFVSMTIQTNQGYRFVSDFCHMLYPLL